MRQLEMTYDLQSLNADQLIELLGDEFQRTVQRQTTELRELPLPVRPDVIDGQEQVKPAVRPREQEQETDSGNQASTDSSGMSGPAADGTVSDEERAEEQSLPTDTSEDNQSDDEESLGTGQTDSGQVIACEQTLTEREREVYGLMTKGKPNNEIASDLNISHKTLDIHRANVMRKMQVKTVGSLVRNYYSAHPEALDEQSDRSDVLVRENTLTPRERDVYRLMAEGKPNNVIAAELGISHKTLDIHRANVMRKLSARTAGDLVRMSMIASTQEQRV
jgi:FixJ family two-component response regulator